MNLLDALLLVGCLFAAVRGYREGALSQLATFGGLAVGVVLGAALAPSIAGAIVSQPGTSLALWTLAFLLMIVLVGQAVGVAAGWRIRRAAHAVGGARVDRSVGTVVGIAAVMLMVWVLAGSFARGPHPEIARQVSGSAVVGAIDSNLPRPPDVFAQVGSYLDRHGFPQAFERIGGGTAPPVDPPSEGAVAAAQQAGAPSTVQIQSLGCSGVSSGSGFVIEPGIAVTNAHVVAGGEQIVVRDRDGEYTGTVIGLDPDLDIAVIAASDMTAPAIDWVTERSERGTSGATMGHPGGQRELQVDAARVRARTDAIGRDIYDGGRVQREVLILTSDVRPGDSGGPFVTGGGRVGGVVFAAAEHDSSVGYAITAEAARPVVDDAIGRSTQVSTGSCRY